MCAGIYVRIYMQICVYVGMRVYPCMFVHMRFLCICTQKKQYILFSPDRVFVFLQWTWLFAVVTRKFPCSGINKSYFLLFQTRKACQLALPRRLWKSWQNRFFICITLFGISWYCALVYLFDALLNTSKMHRKMSFLKAIWLWYQLCGPLKENIKGLWIEMCHYNLL